MNNHDQKYNMVILGFKQCSLQSQAQSESQSRKYTNPIRIVYRKEQVDKKMKNIENDQANGDSRPKRRIKIMENIT